MHGLELCTIRQERLLDLASHGALVHVVDQVSWVLTVDKIRVQQAHLRVGVECLRLGLLALLDPALRRLGEGHVVLDGADRDKVLHTKLVGNLGSCDKRVVLA